MPQTPLIILSYNPSANGSIRPSGSTMKPAIVAENISKKFRIGVQGQGEYRTLRETIVDAVTAPIRRLRNGAQSIQQSEFWALKDVSFVVQPGEALGIIGRNGAGKSTLLKILSHITEPSQGRVRLRGRLASLLEVGTGFHPELTGRENIYLNGSLLGMSRREITAKFDEIVAFSEVERFLDTPVKRFSSGMYVRLAFAIAAHLEPEILIVDEVLAVGDASYQRRCVNRMHHLVRSGCTILFVSHNMDLVPRLCQSALLLDHGRVRTMGEAAPVIESYLSEIGSSHRSGGDLTRALRHGDGRARFQRVEFLHPERAKGAGVHRSGDDVAIRFDIVADHVIDHVTIAVNLRSTSGTKIHSASTHEQNVPVRLQPGEHTFEVRFHRVRFRPGNAIDVELWMETSGTVLDHIVDAMRVPVVDGDDTADFVNRTDQGIVLTEVAWRTPQNCESSQFAPVNTDASPCSPASLPP